jgi:hypothetical protein
VQKKPGAVRSIVNIGLEKVKITVVHKPACSIAYPSIQRESASPDTERINALLY